MSARSVRRAPRSDAGEAAWLEAEELDAWLNLIKLADRIVTLSDTALRRTHAITGRDYELLHHLSQSASGWRVNELAEFIHDTSSCITHRVNRLQASGLVDKRTDPDDQRARRVVLTSAGRSLLARAAPDHAARVRAWIVDPLSRRDLVALGRISGTLLEHLRVVEPAGDGIG